MADALQNLENWLEHGRKCPTCRGTGSILAHRPTIYCTDSDDEIADAYRMASRPCPDFPDFGEVAAELRAAQEKLAVLTYLPAPDEAISVRVRALESALDLMTKDRDDLQSSADLRWKCDMRAIKAWQAAHPGNDLVWPDHADLCVWLMEQLTDEKARWNSDEWRGAIDEARK